MLSAGRTMPWELLPLRWVAQVKGCSQHGGLLGASSRQAWQVPAGGIAVAVNGVKAQLKHGGRVDRCMTACRGRTCDVTAQEERRSSGSAGGPAPPAPCRQQPASATSGDFAFTQPGCWLAVHCWFWLLQAS